MNVPTYLAPKNERLSGTDAVFIHSLASCRQFACKYEVLKGPNDLYFGFAADERLHLLHSGAKVSKAQLIFLFKMLYNIKSADFYSNYPERAMCFMSAMSDERHLLIFVIRHQTIQINRKRENYDI